MSRSTVDTITPPTAFSLQEYLAPEHENAIRHEYRQGLAYAMVSGSDDHSCIAVTFSPPYTYTCAMTPTSSSPTMSFKYGK